MEKIDARSLSPKAQERLRQLAVNAVLDGKKQVEVAKLFSVTRRAISNWLKAYRNGGIQALKAKSKGRPKGGSLLPWQAAQIAKTVVDHHPEQLKLPFYLWTREAVTKLIHRKFGIRVSVSTAGRYLKRWGFTPQKPVRRALEQNPQGVRNWLETEYPAIRQQAKSEKAQIFWGDEMGLRSDHAVGRSYGLRGHTPVIVATGKRFGCNMISAITNQGRLNFMVFKGRFIATVFLEFLNRLVRQSERKVFLIVDRHPVHRSKKAKKWLEKHIDKIRLFFLPGYSPELNPDELLNQDVKSNTIRKNRPSHQDELVKNLRSYLRKRQQQPHIVENYFRGEHVRYASA
ncbi:MAG: IS630 family transposase [Anaerolineales bacterium]|nr:IS630 family transposase [Anaerolineales bacterium]